VLAQHVILQLSEGGRQFQEGRAIRKRTGIALHDRQIMSPVMDRPWWQMVAALDHARMCQLGWLRMVFALSV
jgi:hypothetical protein